MAKKFSFIVLGLAAACVATTFIIEAIKSDKKGE